MSTIHKCDRCDFTTEDDDTLAQLDFEGIAQHNRPDDFPFSVATHYVELCDECQKDLARFLMTKPDRTKPVSWNVLEGKIR